MTFRDVPVVGVRPEVELLLCAARVCLDPERAQQMRTLLRGDMDWAYVLRAAQGHGVLPLLYWHLNATCPDAVPQAILDQLREHFHHNSLRNLFLTGELLKLLKLFATHNLLAVP